MGFAGCAVGAALVSSCHDYRNFSS